MQVMWHRCAGARSSQRLARGPAVKARIRKRGHSRGTEVGSEARPWVLAVNTFDEDGKWVHFQATSFPTFEETIEALSKELQGVGSIKDL